MTIGDYCGLALNHDLLVAVWVLKELRRTFGGLKARSQPQILEFSVSNLRLNLAHILKTMQQLEVLEKRMRTRQCLNKELAGWNDYLVGAAARGGDISCQLVP